MTFFSKPMAYMLVGVPGSGKSTWAEPYLTRADVKLVSSDAYIEQIAKMMGKTYGDIFKATIGEATKFMEQHLNEAIGNTQTIIWDQTNLTMASRRNKLNRLIDAGYDVTAVAFECPAPELKRRREQRAADTGKVISESIIEQMTAKYVRPTRLEGFKNVIIVTPTGERVATEYSNQ